jgi:hypothetical protein
MKALSPFALVILSLLLSHNVNAQSLEAERIRTQQIIRQSQQQKQTLEDQANARKLNELNQLKYQIAAAESTVSSKEKQAESYQTRADNEMDKNLKEVAQIEADRYSKDAEKEKAQLDTLKKRQAALQDDEVYHGTGH